MADETKVVNEKTTPKIKLDFKGEDKKPEIPATVTYRLDCVTTGQSITPDTPLAAASSIDVQLSVAQTTMVNAGNAIETKRVTVKATYAGGGAYNEQWDFQLKNLSPGVS